MQRNIQNTIHHIIYSQNKGHTDLLAHLCRYLQLKHQISNRDRANLQHTVNDKFKLLRSMLIVE